MNLKPGTVLIIWIIAIVTIMVTVASCELKPVHPAPVKKVDLDNAWGVSIVKIRGCEYIQSAGTGAGTLTHCGDCSNPIHYR